MERLSCSPGLIESGKVVRGGVFLLKGTQDKFPVDSGLK